MTLTRERPRDLPIERRLWPRATRTESGCLIWNGAKDADGYGLIRFEGRTTRTHRVAYTLAVGAIPDGHEIDHLCRVHACMEPTHLEPVEHVVNVRRGRSGEPERSKTHCSNNHPFDADNTQWYAGRRVCRTCHREKQARYEARRRAAA